MNFLKLIRYKNLIMVLLTMVLVKYALLNIPNENSSFSVILFSISVFSILCLTAAGYVVNDLLDSKADLINKPNKVYIGKYFSKKTGWWWYGILNIVGIVCCLYVSKIMNLSTGYVIFYAITGLLLFYYSFYLKKVMMIGNIVIALFCSGIILITFLLELEGQNRAETIWQALLDVFRGIFMFLVIFYYMVFSFLTTLIREIIKDIEDIDGDHQMKMKTLPIVIGRKRARNIAIGLSLLLLFVLMIVLKTLFADSPLLNLALYLLITTFLPTIYFIYILWSAKTKKQFHYLSKLMKFIMFFGILSMILFTFE